MCVIFFQLGYIYNISVISTQHEKKNDFICFYLAHWKRKKVDETRSLVKLLLAILDTSPTAV